MRFWVACTLLKFTPPLRGSRRGKGVSPQASRWGELFQWHVPPPNRLSPKGSASSSGFPLGKPDPQGLIEKVPKKVMATPLKGKPHKVNPPYPPLSGGQEKAKPPLPGGGHCLGGGASPFYTPLTRGGRGGCFSSRTETSLLPPKKELFHRAFPSGCPTPQGGSDSLLSRLLAMLFNSEVRTRAGVDQFRARRVFSTTPEEAD